MEELEQSKQRIRLSFDDNILKKSQIEDGLTQSWVLLKPHFETISDVVSYLLHSFDLHDSCPNGIILAMDGFVLPPFESITILKDNDLIRVKRSEIKLLDANKATGDAKLYVEDKIVEYQLLPSDVKLLANEEFREENGGYQSDTIDDKDDAEETTLPVPNVPNGVVTSKKRKASNKVQSSKKKRKRQISPETGQRKHVHHSEHIITPLKKRKHEHKSIQDAVSGPDATEKCMNLLETNSNSVELEENKEKTVQATGVTHKMKKASRSSRRKRLKRIYKKQQRDEFRVDEERKRQQPLKDLSADSGSKNDEATKIIEQAYELSDAEGDLVAIEIRPGHKRFIPSGKAKDVQQMLEANGLDDQQNLEADGLDAHLSKDSAWKEQSDRKKDLNFDHYQAAKETAHWNGISNKRKGQKWGQATQQTSSWKAPRDYDTHSSNTWGGGKQSNCSWMEPRAINGCSSSKWDSRKQPEDFAHVDFEKLVPLIDLPQAGDIVAYRLLELSSSWCPELSSFRIGKIASFEPESNRIMLVPVPGYPLSLVKKTEDTDDDASGQPPESSVYNEDGSLETDFPSLVDVRIVKRGDLTQSEGIKTPAANGASVPSIEAQTRGKNVASDVPSTSKSGNEAHDSKNVAPDVSKQKLDTAAPVNGKKDVWEEISNALSAKKAELLKEDSWNKKESSSKPSWSYRTLRSSAIGPTMARLRAQNGV